MAHPCVHTLAVLPPPAFRLQVPEFFALAAPDARPRHPRGSIRLFAVGSHAGLEALSGRVGALQSAWDAAALAAGWALPPRFALPARLPAPAAAPAWFRPPHALAPLLAAPPDPAAWRLRGWLGLLPGVDASLPGLLPAAVPLRWDWLSTCYSDGACLPGAPNRLGAAFFDGPSGRAFTVNPGGDRSTNTTVRAELAGLDACLSHAAGRPGPLTVFTDALTALFLSRRMSLWPHTLRESKHWHLASSIAATIGARARRGLYTAILKVTAHAGVRGNVQADAAASRARDHPLACDYVCSAANSSHDRLPAWPVTMEAPDPLAGGPAMASPKRPAARAPPHLTPSSDPLDWWSVADLCSSIKAVVCQGPLAVGVAPPGEGTARRAAINAISEPGPSNAAWESQPWAATRALLRARFNCLPTADRLRFCKGPSAAWAAGGRCPLCHQPDSAGHLLGGCAHKSQGDQQAGGEAPQRW